MILYKRATVQYTSWTLTNNSSILKWNHNSFIQLYSKLLETNDLRHAILIETAQVQGSIEHSKATKTYDVLSVAHK